MSHRGCSCSPPNRRVPSSPIPRQLEPSRMSLRWLMKKASFGSTIQRAVKILCSNVGLFLLTQKLQFQEIFVANGVCVCAHVCRMAGSWECRLWRSLGTRGVSLGKYNSFHVTSPLKLTLSFKYLVLVCIFEFETPRTLLFLQIKSSLLSCVVRWLLPAIRWPGCGMWSLGSCWAASRVTSAASSLLHSHHRRKVHKALITFCAEGGCNVCSFLSTDAWRHSVYTLYRLLSS